MEESFRMVNYKVLWSRDQEKSVRYSMLNLWRSRDRAGDGCPDIIGTEGDEIWYNTKAVVKWLTLVTTIKNRQELLGYMLSNTTHMRFWYDGNLPSCVCMKPKGYDDYSVLSSKGCGKGWIWDNQAGRAFYRPEVSWSDLEMSDA